MLAIFTPQTESQGATPDNSSGNVAPAQTDEALNSNSSVSSSEQSDAKKAIQATAADVNSKSAISKEEPILTEKEALDELPAIPLYFPTSYSLVKPYIQGFYINVLNAPSLKDVKINNNWQPKAAKNES